MLARSALFVPASDADRLDKASQRGADLLIADLEDGVGHQDKPTARTYLSQWLARGPRTATWVRVNNDAHLEADLDACVPHNIEGILLPKCDSAEQLHALDRMLAEREAAFAIPPGRLGVVAMIESAAGLQHLSEIIRAPRVQALQLGEADLIADLGMSNPTSQDLRSVRLQIVIASVAAGLASPLAPVTGIFHDEEAFRIGTGELRRLGFYGRACIHPRQVAIANDVFQPTDAEVAAARKIIAALENSGGRACLDDNGNMIDNASIRAAERTLRLIQST